MLDDLLEIVRCPATGERLERRGDKLVTPDGHHAYPILGDTPILVDDNTSIFSVREIATSGSKSSGPKSIARAIAGRLTPSATESIGTEAHFAEFGRLARELAGGRRARILVVGGGELGNGMEAIAEDGDLDFVDTDIYLGPRVMIACDGHHLPFADGSFDGVIAQAVLEHVLDPPEVVAEIYRVLRSGGLVYAETPFMQQVHEGAFDFTRFTELGHRRLFRAFDELDRGVVIGPASALVWSLRYLARSLPRKSTTMARLLDKLVTLAFFWLKYLDRLIVGHAGASDGASGVFFLGRRVEKPISDREIVASYRGSMRSVAVARHIGGAPEGRR
jgi:SAM-dependent methyltransferase/uncharacterized protein YbaR (Trm112 family)